MCPVRDVRALRKCVCVCVILSESVVIEHVEIERGLNRLNAEYFMERDV